VKGPLHGTERSAWTLLPEQKGLLAALLIVLALFWWTRGRPGFLPWRQDRVDPGVRPDPFVLEIEGPLVRSGIYTFPSPVTLERALVTAGMKREFVPMLPGSIPLATGTTVAVSRSGDRLTIRTRPMGPEKRILYGIPIDLNAIGADELTLVPGIGPTIAGRILHYRNLHGNFTDLEELLNVSGVGRKRLEALRPYLSVTRVQPPIP